MASKIDIEKVVEEGIKAEIELIKEELVKKYSDQIQKNLREKMAGIVVRTEQFYRVHTQGHDVVITLVDRAKDRF